MLNADMQVAETLGVEVSEEQLKAFGTFSTRWALTSCAVHFVSQQRPSKLAFLVVTTMLIFGLESFCE